MSLSAFCCFYGSMIFCSCASSLGLTRVLRFCTKKKLEKWVSVREKIKCKYTSERVNPKGRSMALTAMAKNGERTISKSRNQSQTSIRDFRILRRNETGCDSFTIIMK